VFVVNVVPGYNNHSLYTGSIDYMSLFLAPLMLGDVNLNLTMYVSFRGSLSIGTPTYSFDVLWTPAHIHPPFEVRYVKLLCDVSWNGQLQTCQVLDVQESSGWSRFDSSRTTWRGRGHTRPGGWFFVMFVPAEQTPFWHVLFDGTHCMYERNCQGYI
jgi:hypothetical protein